MIQHVKSEHTRSEYRSLLDVYNTLNGNIVIARIAERLGLTRTLFRNICLKTQFLTDDETARFCAALDDTHRLIGEIKAAVQRLPRRVESKRYKPV